MVNKVVSFGLKRDFRNLFKKGIVLRKQSMILRGVDNADQGLRVSYGISRKNVRHAVTRNKMKRWGRECLRQNPDLKNKSLDFLITVEKEIKDYVFFKKNLDELVQKFLNLYCSKNAHHPR